MAVACNGERRVVASPDLQCDGAASGTFEADLDPTVPGAASSDEALDQLLVPFVARQGGQIVDVREAMKAVGTPSTEALATSPPASVPAEPVPANTGAVDDDLGDQAAYEAVLRELNVAVDTAPPPVLELGDATFCGWDELGGPSMPGDKVDAAARSCFVDAHRAGRSAVFVNRTRDNEGAPVPIIFRTLGGQAVLYWDVTKSLSSEAWRTDPCSTLYVVELEAASAAVFSCTYVEGAEAA